jgi:hypothetical protein
VGGPRADGTAREAAPDRPGAPVAEPYRRPDSRRLAIDPSTRGPAGSATKPGRPRSGRARRYRNAALVLGLLVATMAGATGRLLISDLNPATGPTPTPAPTGPASLWPSPSPSPTDTPTSSPTPTGTIPVVTGSTAQVVFHDMTLDNSVSSGQARTFTFISDGQGSVSGHVVAAAPLDNINMCVVVNDNPPACASGATPGFELPTPPGDHSTWVVTVIATKAQSTPIVDLAFSWPSIVPSITLTHGRFQGLPNPDTLRGIIVDFMPRNSGVATLAAKWPPATAKAGLTVLDITTTPATKVEAKTWTGGAITPDYAISVDAKRPYEFILQNSAKDSGRPDLTATLTFP